MEDEGRGFGSSDFGTLLRHYRLAAGLSQEALAERARMSSDGVSALERGHRRTPQRETLALLAGALALSDEQRFEFEAAATRPSRPRSSVTVGPWLGDGVTNLPLALTSFVGREVELKEIAALLRDHRLVTITGAGGVGKTQTALQVASALNDEGQGSAAFVGLAPLTDPSLVLPAIASSLRLQEVPHRPLLETLVAYLKNKSLLLVFDNCEHVITEAANTAATLLLGCPNVRILATSREPLRAAGEHAYRLASLSEPSAVELFVDRACAVDQCFSHSNQKMAVVAEICRLLDGIPLAIELAAARVNVLSVESLAEKLDDRFRVLTGGVRTALPRQQTMRATIEWSYDLLSPREQKIFERLSVFVGGCMADAAAKVCADDEISEADDVFDLLSSLVDKSLVTVRPGGHEPRYVLLESFRHYAHDKLEKRGEGDIIARRHALVCLAFAEQLERAYDLESHENYMTLDRQEQNNWATALRWSFADGHDIILGQWLVCKLGAAWALTVRERFWLVLSRQLADCQTPQNLLSALNYAEAILAFQVEDYDAQLAAAKNAVEGYRRLGDLRGMARAQNLAAWALINLRQIPEARALLREALSVEALGGGTERSFVLRGQAFADALEGDLVSARDHLAEALQVSDLLDSRVERAWALLDLSRYELWCSGDALRALHLASAALVELRAVNNMSGVPWVLNSISEYLIVLGRYEEAATRAREAFDLAREQRLDAATVLAMQHLAAAASLQQGHTSSDITVKHNAARIIGFVDAGIGALKTTRQFTEGEYNRVLAALRDALGADATDRLAATGARLTWDQAADLALNLDYEALR